MGAPLPPQEVSASMRDDFYGHSNDLWHCWVPVMPAQAARSKVGFCRERQNLAVSEGFFFPERQAQDVQHCL